jgi:hypothetical protein
MANKLRTIINAEMPYINYGVLINSVKKIITAASGAASSAEEKLYSNAIDPFSAIIDSMRQKISIAMWMEQEKARQIQKTMQNELGEFHQSILGNMPGWVDLGTGNVVDIKNSNKKIIAEVKNKHNTCKGNHKVRIYDDLKSLLVGGSHGFCGGYKGYYIEVIPKNRSKYDKCFTPSDNERHKRRAKREDIRVIDGYSFYALASGDKDALRKLYLVLPKVVGEILDVDPGIVERDKYTNMIFEKTY